jgi:TonB-dependent SusC/RagA subfamily outer membrane receptor
MKNAIRFLIAFLVMWLSGMSAFAQSPTITGKVTDAKGEGLPGVSVIARGTMAGTYTEDDGSFMLAIPSNITQLEFKYLGFKTETVTLTAGNVVNVTLQEDVLGLDEVVVTALGIPKEKKALGYSTQAIGSDELNKSGQGNPLSELNGKVSGLTVINSAGDPGAGTYIRLRGVTSLTGNNQPLIIVDGIPLDNSINIYDPVNTGFLAATAAGNNLGSAAPDNRGVDINPADIASITVLKGPAATALYGLQAASGALIITTKKGGGPGRKGTNIDFQTSYSLDYVNQYPELQDIYAQGNNGQYLGPTAPTGNKRFSWGPLADTLYWDGIATEYDQHGSIVGQSDPAAVNKVVPYDPQHDFFRTGSTFNNSLSLSGGNDNSGYRLSIGNINQQGVVPLTN